MNNGTTELLEGKYVDMFVAYRFLRILTIPWTEQPAFKHGIIDENGKRIKSKKLTTSEEKDAYTLVHRLVFNFKRVLSKVPLVKSKLGTYAAALFLLKEHLPSREYEILIESVVESGEFTYDILDTINQIDDDMGIVILDNVDGIDLEEDIANVVGSGEVAMRDLPLKKKPITRVDARTKAFRSAIKRIKERNQKKIDSAIREKLLKMGIDISKNRE
jgi:hypothetical protein